MKKRILSLAAFTLLAATITSCSLTYPVAVSDAKMGTKRGESKTVRFLSIDFNGKYGIKDAANNGKITGPVSTVDEKYTSYILFSTKKLIITGE